MQQKGVKNAEDLSCQAATGAEQDPTEGGPVVVVPLNQSN